ncbi:hypothetical protein MOQ72_17915 [Saccharopolyspora sp. K220]|uniref:hypothetical protein n=1 Tax=Saccharopolyspora soli TaxID=2926618 RepID=UPI001F577EC1|nr:hypothetical protein [Saccharopolyspora soli]MCI2419324.1 hypothetical protein [Saccharopolyspora soli]
MDSPVKPGGQAVTSGGGLASVDLVLNATTRLEKTSNNRLADVADIVINTADIGVAKPDPRVYLIAARQVGVPTHR